MNKLLNPNYNEEFGDYLVANGFAQTHFGDPAHFSKEGKMVMISGDCVDVANVGGEKMIDGYATFRGISTLTLLDFQFLMHVMKVVTIPQFVRNVKAAEKSSPDFFKILFKESGLVADEKRYPVSES